MLNMPEGQRSHLGPTWTDEPLSVPSRRFWSYSMDWITGLLPSGPMAYNSVITVVNRTTQQVRILPYVLGAGVMSSEAITKLFFEAVLRFYGLPDEVLHDRDPRFTAEFWHELWKLLGSKAVFSSAYHP